MERRLEVRCPFANHQTQEMDFPSRPGESGPNVEPLSGNRSAARHAHDLAGGAHAQGQAVEVR